MTAVRITITPETFAGRGGHANRDGSRGMCRGRLWIWDEKAGVWVRAMTRRERKGAYGG